MLLKIQLTSTIFAKIDVKQNNNTFFSSSPCFFEINREVPAFFFQNCGKFLQFKTPTRGQRKVGENPTPEAVNPSNPRDRPGGMVRLRID